MDQNPQVLLLAHVAEAVFPVLPFHKLHRVEGAAVGAEAQVVHRHDVGVLQLAGDHRLAHEVVAVRLEFRLVRADLLDRHGAVEGGLPRLVHHTHAARERARHKTVVGRLVRSEFRGAVLDPPEFKRAQPHVLRPHSLCAARLKRLRSAVAIHRATPRKIGRRETGDLARGGRLRLTGTPRHAARIELHGRVVRRRTRRAVARIDPFLAFFLRTTQPRFLSRGNRGGAVRRDRGFRVIRAVEPWRRLIALLFGSGWLFLVNF